MLLRSSALQFWVRLLACPTVLGAFRVLGGLF